MKKVPLRRCLALNKSFPKNELFRVVKTPDGEVVLDMTEKLNGRGAYISMSKEAIEVAKKTNCLGKALEVEIPEKVFDKMMFYIK